MAHLLSCGYVNHPPVQAGQLSPVEASCSPGAAGKAGWDKLVHLT